MEFALAWSSAVLMFCFSALFCGLGLSSVYLRFLFVIEVVSQINFIKDS